jgi:hypothetical protein
MKWIFALLLVALACTTASASVIANPVLVGTYTINQYDNSAGCSGDVGGGYRNPYYCVTPPGPIYVNDSAGLYEVVVTAVTGPGGNFYVWDGDASGGTPYSLSTAGATLDLDHTFGSIVFYNHDWYAADNNPAGGITYQLYASGVPEPGTAALMLLGVAAGIGCKRGRRSMRPPK